MNALIGFAVLFFFLLVFTLIPAARIWRAREWVEVPCVICGSDVLEDATDEGLYRVAVAFQYEFNGATWLSRRYDLVGGWSALKFPKRRIVARLPLGARTTCWVNPLDPGEAVLERGVTAELVLVSVFMALMTGGFLFLAWKKAL